MNETVTKKTQKHFTVIEDDIGSDQLLKESLNKNINIIREKTIINGTVISINNNYIIVDVGYKKEGIVLKREMYLNEQEKESFNILPGDTIEVFVITLDDKEGRLLLSRRLIYAERRWKELQDIYSSGGTVTGKVIEVVRGGLIMDIGMRAFLPASLISPTRISDFNTCLGETYTCKILELDQLYKNIVLSRRELLQKAYDEDKIDLLSQMQRGQIRKGVVSHIMNFGVFVSFGSVDGLIHISELSWSHVKHPTDIVKLGDVVDVEIINIDYEKKRVSLSIKSLIENPWVTFTKLHQIGQIIKCKVSNIVQFGVFMKDQDTGIEGLVHISELATSRIESPTEIIEQDKEYCVKIIDIDPDMRHISLSLKQANQSLVKDKDKEGEYIFNPKLYTNKIEEDDEGNFIYPKGFDVNNNSWLPGHDVEKKEWEIFYKELFKLFELHKKQAIAFRALMLEKYKDDVNKNEEQDNLKEHDNEEKE